MAAICWLFLAVSTVALLMKWTHWNTYEATVIKRPAIVKGSRYLSYLVSIACFLFVLDRWIHENDYPDLDRAGAVHRLSRAITCKTINYADHSLTDYGEFDRLQAHIKVSYPAIMSAGSFELVGHHAVLIAIPGSDPTLRPCLYMSHQDVVPVVEGTERDWTYPAFSGAVKDGYIWGRGALDIKEQVFGILEAAEYLLAHGSTFSRPLIWPSMTIRKR